MIKAEVKATACPEADLITIRCLGDLDIEVAIFSQNNVLDNLKSHKHRSNSYIERFFCKNDKKDLYSTSFASFYDKLFL